MSDYITDALGSDTKTLEKRAGVTGRLLIDALDRAVHMQTSVIENYVNWLRKKNPNSSPAEIQEAVDKHFKTLASGTGGGAGLAAAIPGVGFVTGAAAIGAESIVFLDAAAFYTMASAHLRGVDIRDEARRRALILVVLLGSAGTAVIDTMVGDLSKEDVKRMPTTSVLGRFAAPKLGEVNNRLMRVAIQRFGKQLRGAWLGKIMPLGIGVVAGTIANRKLADKVMENSRKSMGPLPAAFSMPVPEVVEEPQVLGVKDDETKKALWRKLPWFDGK